MSVCGCFEFNYFDKRLETIEHLLIEIKKQGEKHMSVLDDKITAINTAVTKLGTDLSTLITDLKSNSGAGAPTAAQLASLDTIAQALTSIDSTVTSSDPGPVTAA